MKMWAGRRVWAYLVVTLGLMGFLGGERRPTPAALPFLTTPYYGETQVSQWYHAGHKGVDFLLRYEPVLAAAAGTVRDVRWYSNDPICHQYPYSVSCGYGLHIRIQHPNGYWSIYAHLSATAFRLDPIATSVWQGEVLGTSGHTGYSTGPHLHFEVRPCESCAGVDPFDQRLWGDGEWAGRPLPAPGRANEVVVDDSYISYGGFSKGYGGVSFQSCTGACGGWSRKTGSASGSAYGGDLYHTPADGGWTMDQWARWQPDVPPGLYEILIHVPSVHATTWQAEYRVVSPEGYFLGRGVVDQLGLPDPQYPASQWVSIGAYELEPGGYVYTTDATRESAYQHCQGVTWCSLGIDAVKFVRLTAAYLPNLKPQPSGWTPYIRVRNNGAGTALVRLSQLNSQGQEVSAGSYELPKGGTVSFGGAAGQAVAAVLDATQRVSVVVENRRTNVSTNYTGIVAPDQSANPGWGEADTTLYAPTVKYDHYGRTTDLFILNAGEETANVRVDYYNASGQKKGALTAPCQNLAPRGSCKVTLPNANWGRLLAARITTSSSPKQPLAGVAVDRNGNYSQVGTYNLTAEGSKTLYAPLIKKDYYGQFTGLRVFNPHSSASASVTVTYYDSASGKTYTVFPPHTIPPHGSVTLVSDSILPDGFLGSARVTSNRPVVASLHESGTARKMASNLFHATASRRSIAARVCQNCYDGMSWMITGLRVQNVGNGSANVQIQFYSSTGAPVGGPKQIPNLGKYRAENVIGTPSKFSGSAVLTADQPIVAIVNLANGNTGKDLAMTYNAANE